MIYVGDIAGQHSNIGAANEQQSKIAPQLPMASAKLSALIQVNNTCLHQMPENLVVTSTYGLKMPP